MSDITPKGPRRADDLFRSNSINEKPGYISGFRDLFQIVFSFVFDLPPAMETDLRVPVCLVLTSRIDEDDVRVVPVFPRG
ncbi:hypothetical protein [Actinopolyspora erythraea]|uniref:hypothetical protein n=1 Tax=Actinopolyspora erythraea TaxID=414996 RepID=UPI0011856529|nr:hypothetical protein [Actinopolyspora erythraea]